ncbi:MAG TPA: hypothetical protein VMK12_06780, partial [Anaeromyxobacteraceae bacterium]|nr:hypothetical protein [Anaeromyxobacteraceae bacterium]
RYQEPMLEALRVERDREHHKNLLLAPTGTGKTFAFGGPPLDEDARRLHARVRNVLHVTDPERLAVLRSLANDGPLSLTHPGSAETEARLLAMAAAALLDCRRPAGALAELEAAGQHPSFRAELSQLLDVIEDTNRDLTLAWLPGGPLAPAPLHIHARYRQEEVLVSFNVVGERSPQIPRLQAGVFYVEEDNVDLLFVTLKKIDAGFSPTTMYRDCAMSPTRFHQTLPTLARRLVVAISRDIATCPSSRARRRNSRKGVAEPYWFPGAVTLESASGERPMRIVWRLEHPMPKHLYQRATLAVG